MTGGENSRTDAAHAGAEIGPVGLLKAPLLEVLPGKGLDDPLCREIFLEQRCKAGHRYLGVLGDASCGFPSAR